MKIIAGDVGGTKTNIALFDGVTCHHEPILEQTVVSKGHDGLASVINEFLKKHNVAPPEVSLGCFGIAGAIVDQVAQTPNLPWTVSAKRVSEETGLRHVHLLNDLEATGHGIAHLPSGKLHALNDVAMGGDENRALIAAGTGLGQAFLITHSESVSVYPTEGGHCDFAPRSDLELDLLRYVRAREGRVSYESVLSGPGLVRIFEFLRTSGRVGLPSDELRSRVESGDAAAEIAGAALRHEDRVAEVALDTFVGIYGAEAGNVALKVLARGGLFVGGGIAPKILQKLADGQFMAAFCDKAPFTDLMRSIPVHVILEPKTALLGAAHVAFQLREKY